MSNCVEIYVIVEGKTEQDFIKNIVAPYLASKNIWITPVQVTKPGQKGGDVKFTRVKKDLRLHLRQRQDTFVTTFVDYYGVKEWPGKDKVGENLKPEQIAKVVNQAVMQEVKSYIPREQIDSRFIPFIAVYEFEALLFSDSVILAKELGINKNIVDSVLHECGEPEAINDSPQTAPSKRLLKWKGNFSKTIKGISIAKKIGIEKMRKSCPNFNSWLTTIEGLNRK